MKGFKEVTKEEFQEFVKSYPNKLDWNVAGMYEPPLGSHNDFTGGKVWLLKCLLWMAQITMMVSFLSIMSRT